MSKRDLLSHPPRTSPTLKSIPKQFIYKGGKAPKDVVHVIVDKIVREIEDEAFRDCTCLRSIELHIKLERIGHNAFYNCGSLESINLPGASSRNWIEKYWR